MPSGTPTGFPTEYMMPTDYYMPLPMTVVYSVCMEGDSVLESLGMPSDAVVVNNIEGDNLSFTVTQEITTSQVCIFYYDQ